MDQRRRQPDLEDGHGNQDGDVGPGEKSKLLLHRQKSEQAQRAQEHPCRREPQGGNVLEPQFHDRPVHSPKQDDQSQQKIRPAQGFLMLVFVNGGLCPSAYLPYDCIVQECY